MRIISCVQLFATPWTRQAPLSMGFSRQEYWVVDTSSSRDLPNPGIKPASPMPPALEGRFFAHWATWEARKDGTYDLSLYIGGQTEILPMNFYVYFCGYTGSPLLCRALCGHGEQAATRLWCAGFSCCEAQAPGTQASAVMVQLQWLQPAASVVRVPGLSRSAARRIFLDQGSNSCPLHWQANSYPLCP